MWVLWREFKLQQQITPKPWEKKEGGKVERMITKSQHDEHLIKEKPNTDNNSLLQQWTYSIETPLLLYIGNNMSFSYTWAAFLNKSE